MEPEFEIPVHFRNQELLIPAALRVQGYSYRIETEVEGLMLNFERDDSGEFRALIPPETAANAKLPPTELVAAIAAALDQLLA